MDKENENLSYREKNYKSDGHDTSNQDQVILTTDLKMDKTIDIGKDDEKNTEKISLMGSPARTQSIKSSSYMKNKSVEIPKHNRVLSSGCTSNSQIIEENGEDDLTIGIDIKQKCTKIFFNYAKYSLELKEFFISHYTIFNLLKTVNVLSIVQKSEIDVILRKQCNKGTKLSLKDFMDFLILLVKKMYPDNYCDDQIGTIIYVIKNFFEPLSNFIDNKTFNPEKNEKVAPYNNVFHQKIIESMIKFIDNGVVLMIRDSFIGIKEIYKAYFFFELNKFSNKDTLFFGSLSNMIEFFKDFEIMPALCGINQLVIYWNFITGLNVAEMTNNPDYPYLIEEKFDMGSLMTLSKFCALLVYLGIMFYNRNKPGGGITTELKDSGNLLLNIF